LDRELPSGKALHLILDNYGTHGHPKVREWLARGVAEIKPDEIGAGASSRINGTQGALVYKRKTPIFTPLSAAHNKRPCS
jgi:hypothetical protein